MANLAIKGHPSRGKEVIEILEMLGGWNYNRWDGKTPRTLYFINTGLITLKTIRHNTNIDEFSVFTLEEFEKTYPYKVGDKVEFKSIGDANLKSKIIYMEWCNSLNKVLYTTEDAQVISTEDIIETKSIPSYKEEIMEENVCKKNISGIDDDAIFRFNYSMRPEVNADGMLCYKIPEGYETFSVQNGMIILKPKKPTYPKTYEECCKILGIEDRENGYCGYEYELLGEFQKLYICRNAYRKIAGEQMGLDKPWKPDWNNVSDKHCIYFISGEIWSTECQTRQCTLVFPTAEMRDAFYDNFKELIDKCKELL